MSNNTPRPWSAWKVRAAALWRQRNPREQRAIALAACALVALALWLVIIKPAWVDTPKLQSRWQALSQQRLMLSAAAQEVQRLRDLPQLPPLSDNARTQAIQASVAELGGNAQVSPEATGVSVQVQGMDGAKLQPWLQQVQIGAQARPTRIDLQQHDGRWQGRIDLSWPRP